MKLNLKGYLILSLITLLATPNLMANPNVDQKGLKIYPNKISNNFSSAEAANTGAEWCQQHKLTSNCFPLNNQLNNSIHVSIPEFNNEVDFPANVTLRFADVANPPKIKSCKVTITDNKSHKLLYQGDFDDMVGLICSNKEDGSSCKVWKKFK
ncbi:hypothetical protein D5018_12220 [Parashewanella curva]|uniref:Uncharacterized protein n=1 Tax=Parashewanella curva TaxID=2338552 RepID=A0A3L8PVK6_9GAMM|nr:hypothetical protein [Parashewanella curva]RLV59457.1 hypothetical protein D5018_12220 [Parashewanella curva]